MESLVESLGTVLAGAKFETRGTIGAVEWYFAPLHLSYEQIGAKNERRSNNKECV